MTNTLKIVCQSIQREQGGEYSCTATNDYGKTRSNTIDLDVKCKHIQSFAQFVFIQELSDSPSCKEKDKLIVNTLKNHPVVFSCDMEANPANNMNFKWTLNNSEHNVELEVLTTSSSSS